MAQQVQTNPKVTQVPVPAAGSIANGVVIRLSTWAKYVTVNEDPAYNGGIAQGLQYCLLNPQAPAANITLGASPAPPAYIVAPPAAPGLEQLTVGDPHHVHSKSTQPLGNPGNGGVDSRGYALPANLVLLGTPMLILNSNGAATGVIVKEYA